MEQIIRKGKLVTFLQVPSEQGLADIPDSEHVPEHGPQLKFEMPADDEGSRKKRGAENQLTQHNWDNEGDEETPASVT